MTIQTEKVDRPFPALPLETLDAEQRALADQLLKASGGYYGGPIPILLRSPQMSARLRPLITYFALQSSLPKRLSELAILIQAKYWDQEYEWWAHLEIAHDAKLSAATTTALKEGRRPTAMAEDEAAVYDLCMQLLNDHRVNRDTLSAVRDHLNDQQIVDLTAVSGVYALLAMLLNLAEEQSPSDAPRPRPGIE